MRILPQLPDKIYLDFDSRKQANIRQKETRGMHFFYSQGGGGTIFSPVPPDPDIKKLIQALNDSSLMIRRSAVLELGEFGGKAVPELIEALKNESIRDAVIMALGAVGEEAVPALIEALKDKDSDIRRSAARALSRIGNKAKGAVPALAEALKDNNLEVRQAAASALSRIGEKLERAIPALAEALKDNNLSLRLFSALALSKMGEKAKEALLEVQKDKNGSARLAAKWTMDVIEGRENSACIDLRNF